MDSRNLNLTRIPHSLDGDYSQSDHSVEAGDISVYFKNIKEALIGHIRDADVVLGCVAWLTDGDLLDELAGKRWVSLVVQKEDFLRPDIDGRASKPVLLHKYKKLKCGTRYSFMDTIVPRLTTNSDPTLDAVRCVGNCNSDAPVNPRAHHKFVLFCREMVSGEDDCHQYPIAEPYAVWTGSYNFSYTASLSLENALVTSRREIVDAYFKEWGQVVALSQPLNWRAPWVAPQWRIGT